MGQHATGERDGLAGRLLAAAAAARERAHTPYSGYPVGAALLTADGGVFTGCNVENAAYPLTMCAERVAVFRAVAEGQRQFVALAVVTANGGSPCGSCRQVLREFNAGDLPVFIGTPDGQYRATTLAELLPDSFGPESLTKPNADPKGLGDL